MELLSHMVTFAHVVQAGSFAGGAKRLGLSTSVASKHIAKLERSLGAKLLNRSTRTLSLTEIGSAYYAHCARVAEELDSAERAVSGLQGAPSGRLRVSAPPAMVTQHIVPILRDFHALYPDILLDIDLGNRVVDLAEDGFDLALRVLRAPPTNVVAFPLAPIRMVVCASPAYVKQHGAPRLPADLREHPCLRFNIPGTSDVWTFRRGTDVVTVDVQGFIRVNTVEPLRLLALEGMGIAILPTFVVGRDIQRGRLLRLIPDWQAGPEGSLYAVHLRHRYVPPKLQCFIEFLQERFGMPPYWDRGLFDESAMEEAAALAPEL